MDTKAISTIALIVIVALIIAVASGVGVYYALLRPSNRTLMSTASYSSKLYNNQIGYVPPTSNETTSMEGCGIYARAQYSPPTAAGNGTLTNESMPSDGVIFLFLPIGTVVVLTYFGIFNGTTSCPVPSSLIASIDLGTSHYGTLKLPFERTRNNSVYGASFTFTSGIPDVEEDITLFQLPFQYHSTVSIVTADFNMGPSHVCQNETGVCSINIANTTVYTISR